MPAAIRSTAAASTGRRSRIPEWQALARWANTGKPAATAAASADFETYRARIEPIFLKERDGPTGRASCAGCHSGIATRLKLQPPAVRDAWTGEQSRQNFAAASQLIVAGDPAKSRLLRAPARAVGGRRPEPHRRQVLEDRRTIRNGRRWPRGSRSRDARCGAAAAAARPLDFEFFKTRVQPMFMAKRDRAGPLHAVPHPRHRQRLRLAAAGRRRDDLDRRAGAEELRVGVGAGRARRARRPAAC